MGAKLNSLTSSSLEQKLLAFSLKLLQQRAPKLDTSGVPDLPLTKLFGKVIFNLTQATVMPFNLIVI